MKKSISTLSLLTFFLIALGATASYARNSTPQLGVFLGELTAELREGIGYQDQGVVINDVVKGSGAEKAGLEKDDIIMEFNNQKVSSIQDLVSAVRETKPGDLVTVKYFRKGETESIPVEITEKKDWLGTTAPHKWIYFRGDRPYLGLKLQPLTSQLAEYFEVQFGVLITEVKEDGPGQRANLKAGDIIVTWQGNQIRNMREFYRQLHSSAEGDKIVLRVIRHGQELDKEVTLEAPRRPESYGFYINRDDTGDLVFRMGGKRFPTSLDIPLPDIDLDLKELKDYVKSLQNGLDTYHEEMKELRDDVQKLKEEIKGLKENGN